MPKAQKLNTEGFGMKTKVKKGTKDIKVKQKVKVTGTAHLAVASAMLKVGFVGPGGVKAVDSVPLAQGNQLKFYAPSLGSALAAVKVGRGTIYFKPLKDGEAEHTVKVAEGKTKLSIGKGLKVLRFSVDASNDPAKVAKGLASYYGLK